MSKGLQMMLVLNRLKHGEIMGRFALKQRSKIAHFLYKINVTDLIPINIALPSHDVRGELSPNSDSLFWLVQSHIWLSVIQV